MLYKMDSGSIRNVQMCYKCMLLGTVLYLYANAGVQAQIERQQQQQQQQQHQEQHLQNNQEQQQEKHDFREHLQQQHEQIPLVRLPSNTLLKYTAYKDVSILHFHIPTDTRTAYFSFKAYEETRSAFLRYCKPRDITLHLKAGSYPVISPENITFPKHFLHADQRFEIYNLQFKSDGMTRRLSVDGPHPGNWFAVAFITWTDPNNDRIEQQGLTVTCETLLLSEMSVVRTVPIILNVDNGLWHNNTLIGSKNTNTDNTQKNNTSSSSNISDDDNKNDVNTNAINDSNKFAVENHEPINYKFFVPRDVDIVTWHFKVLAKCAECPPIVLYAQANGLPTAKNYIQTSVIYANQTDETVLDFYPERNGWHYLEINFLSRIIAMPDTAATSTPSSSQSPVPSTSLPDDLISTKTKSSNRKNKLNKLKTDRDTNSRRNESVVNYHVDFSIKLTFTYEIRNENKQNDNDNRDNENKSSPIMADVVNNGTKTESSSVNSIEQTMPASTVAATTTNTIDVVAPTASGTTTKAAPIDRTTPNGKLLLPQRNIDYYPLLRQTYREFFMFDYDLLPDDNGTIPTFINLTAGTPTGFRFEVGNVYDIGGTLSFAVVMKDNLRDATTAAAGASASAALIKPVTHMSSDAIAEKLVDGGGFDEIHSMNYEVNRLNVNDDAEDVDDDRPVGRSNQTIIICMHLGQPGIPTWPDKCVYGHRTYPAASIVNNTNDETSTGLVHVPFPESGMWYVTLGLYCHGAETAARVTIIDSVKDFIKKYVDLLDEMRTPCACANRTAYHKKCILEKECLHGMSESETLKVKECLMDSKCTVNYQDMAKKFELHHKFATEQSVATDSSCNTSAVFTISSSPCVAGRCGRYGRCYHYMSGGFVFSTCLCIKGYRGWDCTETDSVPTSFSILLGLMLLTLSNLLFIPSIYFAIRRKYYTEGVIYFFAMFFSIFYHACDSGEDEYGFCLVKIGVLQFCDFYCGLLAIWVTLIAMAHIRQTFVSLLHMFGAILLAFGTELNKQSLWVFLAPALTGLCLISVSWGWRCRRTQKWFPARKYLSIFLPIGMVLVMVGLICYAFLQTRQNYHIVHSIWHMVMALSILCLLPNRKTFLPKC